MSRTTIIILFVLALMALHVAGIAQHPSDSLVFGVAEMDTLLDDTIECYPYQCKVQRCHYWMLPMGFDGVIDLNADPTGTYEVQLARPWNMVRLDTCMVLCPFAGQGVRLFYTAGTNATLAVCGIEGATVIVTAKPDTSTAHDTLPEPIVLLDTLCGTVNNDPQQVPCSPCNYISITSLTEYLALDPILLPAGLYWQWCGDRRQGKKILLLR